LFGVEFFIFLATCAGYWDLNNGLVENIWIQPWMVLNRCIPVTRQSQFSGLHRTRDSLLVIL
jgi:hypothetical protein